MRTIGAAVVVVAMFAVGCGADTSGAGDSPVESASIDAEPVVESPSPDLSAPETAQRAPAGPDDPDQAFVTLIANKVLVSDGAALAVLIDRDGTIAEASNGFDDSGRAPTADDSFRVGSITKAFTSLAVLTLVDEGAVELDAPAGDYITRVTVREQATVRDLLQHTSGYVDVLNILEQVLEDPARAWTPDEAVEARLAPIADDPSSEYVYANSNYLILGMLIEEVTGQPYETVIRERITAPLALNDTYVAGYEEGTDPFDRYVPRGQDQYDYTAFSTASWAAGAIVSTAPDLHIFFAAMFDERIISAELLEMMTANSDYGLGIVLTHWDHGLVGHGGRTPGYATLVVHSTETGSTAFFASTDKFAQTESAVRAVFEGLADGTATSPD